MEYRLARQAEDWGFTGLLLADSHNLNADIWVELALAGWATSHLRPGPGATKLRDAPPRRHRVPGVHAAGRDRRARLTRARARRLRARADRAPTRPRVGVRAIARPRHGQRAHYLTLWSSRRSASVKRRGTAGVSPSSHIVTTTSSCPSARHR